MNPHTFKLNIHADTAVFWPDPKPELARILRTIADKLDQDEDVSHFLTIHDVNGNDVGRYALKDDLA